MEVRKSPVRASFCLLVGWMQRGHWQLSRSHAYGRESGLERDGPEIWREEPFCSRKRFREECCTVARVRTGGKRAETEVRRGAFRPLGKAWRSLIILKVSQEPISSSSMASSGGRTPRFIVRPRVQQVSTCQVQIQRCARLPSDRATL